MKTFFKLGFGAFAFALLLSSCTGCFSQQKNVDPDSIKIDSAQPVIDSLRQDSIKRQEKIIDSAKINGDSTSQRK